MEENSSNPGTYRMDIPHSLHKNMIDPAAILYQKDDSAGTRHV
jgi:hypothetical protein